MHFFSSFLFFFFLKTGRVYCSKRRHHNGSFQNQHILHGCIRKFTSNSYFISFFLSTSEMCDTCVVIRTRPNFPYTKYGGRERTHESGKRSYPYVKKSFKTQHGRIPIDPAILPAIGHGFIAQKKKKKLKMPTSGSEATPAETRNRRLFFLLKVINW